MKNNLEQDVLNNFGKKKEDLVMEIIKDNNTYRHISFRSKSNSCDGWFDIITWPGSLCINGDYGTYVFSRTTDMFSFFRNEHENWINPGYWAEKVKAQYKNSPVIELSEEKIKTRVKEELVCWIRNNRHTSKDFRRNLWEDVEDVIGACELNERLNKIYSYSYSELEEPDFSFQDIFEWDVEEYTFHYLWCCFAISWAIKQYDLKHTDKKGITE